MKRILPILFLLVTGFALNVFSGSGSSSIASGSDLHEDVIQKLNRLNEIGDLNLALSDFKLDLGLTLEDLHFALEQVVKDIERIVDAQKNHEERMTLKCSHRFSKEQLEENFHKNRPIHPDLKDAQKNINLFLDVIRDFKQLLQETSDYNKLDEVLKRVGFKFPNSIPFIVERYVDKLKDHSEPYPDQETEIRELEKKLQKGSYQNEDERFLDEDFLESLKQGIKKEEGRSNVENLRQYLAQAVAYEDARWFFDLIAIPNSQNWQYYLRRNPTANLNEMFEFKSHRSDTLRGTALDFIAAKGSMAYPRRYLVYHVLKSRGAKHADERET